MYAADAAQWFAYAVLILTAIRLVQTHIAQDSTLGSALAFIFH
jgi:hypothetical protein